MCNGIAKCNNILAQYLLNAVSKAVQLVSCDVGMKLISHCNYFQNIMPVNISSTN